MITLLTLVPIMTAMLVASAAPAMAYIEQDNLFRRGTSLPTVVCDTTVASPLIGWNNGQYWVFHAASRSFF